MDIWKFRTQNNESWRTPMNSLTDSIGTYTDSFGKRSIFQMQGLFTSNMNNRVWCHNNCNAEVYYKHHRIIE